MGDIYGGRKICPSCAGGKLVKCSACDGWGHPADDGHKVCPSCSGGGYVSCPACGGCGSVPREKPNA